MLIKPIDLTLYAYGQKANVAKIRKAAEDFLADEHDEVDPTWFDERPSSEVAETIQGLLWDQGTALRKATPAQPGLIIRMPAVHERMTTEWLFELKVAKTGVLFATWFSEAEQVDRQLLDINGEQWADRRDTD